MRSRTQQLEKLAERQRRIEAEIERIQAAEAEQQRKRDTRRKIVVGAMVLGLVERGEWSRDQLFQELDRQLTRKQDRDLFDLPPRLGAVEPIEKTVGRRSPRAVPA